MKRLSTHLFTFSDRLRKQAMWLLAVFVCCLLCDSASAQTTVPGSTLASAHWTLAGSPYKIAGHIIVANGDSLVIDPGVVVEFHGKYKLFCNGKIIAKGTSSQHILFTVPAANQSTGWLGIRYDNTPSTNGRSYFQYCTIEYGRADVTGDNLGGGIYFNNFSNCEISNSVIRNCYAQGGGGAICGINSSPSLSRDSILNNTSGNGGWGVHLQGSSSTIDGCLFTGGGVYSLYSYLYIANNYFTKCTYEGGISSFSNSTTGYTQILHNVFDSCSQANGGGGGAVLLSNAQGRIEHNIFRNNVSVCAGGAISVWTQTVYANSSNVLISNNLFYGNRAHLYPAAGAPFGGGAIAFSNCSGRVMNNTIVNNQSDTAGGAIFCGYGSSPSFYNNIIFDNNADAGGENIFVLDNSSDPNFYHNDLQGGYTAINTNGTPLVGANVNNINATPVFTNASGGIYTLATGSPCIDAGTTAGVGTYIPALDLGGNTRVTNVTIDMGAYETAGPPASGINEKETETLCVYPNPAARYFEIKGMRINEMEAVQVMDMLGRELARFENVASNRFDISNIIPGNVLVRVQYKNGSADLIRMVKY
jgi:hypothetical protein